MCSYHKSVASSLPRGLCGLDQSSALPESGRKPRVVGYHGVEGRVPQAQAAEGGEARQAPDPPAVRPARPQIGRGVVREVDAVQILERRV